MSMVNKGWNDHEIAAEITAVNFVDHSESWRIRPAVVEHYLYLPLADEDPVVVQMMRVPALDFAGTNCELVDVHHGSRMRSTLRSENFAERSAVVHVGARRLDSHAIN